MPAHRSAVFAMMLRAPEGKWQGVCGGVLEVSGGAGFNLAQLVMGDGVAGTVLDGSSHAHLPKQPVIK